MYIEFCFVGFFYWSLAFSSLTVVCPSGVLVFVLPGISWIFLDLQVNCSHQNFRGFQLLFLQIFSAHFFLPHLLLKVHHPDVGTFDFVLWVTEALLPFFHLSSFCSSDMLISIDPSSVLWFFNLTSQICYRAHLLNFSFHYCTNHLLNFHLLRFYFPFLFWNSPLINILLA